MSAMNRKQRRAAQAAGAKSARISPANTAAAQSVADLLGAAMAFHQAGALAEAERLYRQILSLVPANAEAHSRLGAVLMAGRRNDEAIFHMERAVALQPDLFAAYGNLAQAYVWTGQGERAIEAACRALEIRETPQSKALFAQCIGFGRFTADNGRFRRLVLRALLEAWVRPRDLTAVCISLIKLNPAVQRGIAQSDAAWPDRVPVVQVLEASGALAQDQLLCRLLECDPIIDIGLERFLTNVRHAMLMRDGAQGTDLDLLDFYCAVARQCFINEYVFATTEIEARQVARISAALDAALAAGESFPSHWPILVGAYQPLHVLANASALLNRSWPPCLEALITQQIREPEEEHKIAATIPTLTSIDGEVSRAVRQQYEENPYPRWAKAGPSQLAIIGASDVQEISDVLIAGCGTGLSTMEFAQQAPHARILAIDLSIASLSYAKRMARNAGLASVEFAQADLMKLGSIGRSFDLINAAGVLHHLADPWAGWRVLLTLLNPGGTMQVALYSEIARSNVVVARELIAARGYQPIPEDIRRCRQEIMAAQDPLLRSLLNSTDFYTISECRDLLFHTQEHRVRLREIKAFLLENNLQFAGFFLDAPTLHHFTARFPKQLDLLNLDCWDSFETEVPRAFAGMYQFSVRKPR